MQKRLNEVFKSHFSCIEDPRIERRKRHLLIDVIAIAICAVISGADHWIDIEAYAQEKEEWLKTFLALPNGIPSHDTIARVFSRLEPIAQQIKAQEADYVLAVKENQERLFQSLKKTFLKAEGQQFNAMTYSTHKTVEGDHGRIETRRYTVLPLMYLHHFKCRWSGLQSLVQVESHRQIKGGEFSQEKRYYISSLPMDAPLMANAIRAHWRIENNLHWSLDVIFREDQSRIRKAHAPENVGWLRQFALSLLKKEPTLKTSIRRKRFKALMNDTYLLAVLNA